MPCVIEKEQVILTQASDRLGQIVSQGAQRRVFVDPQLQLDRHAGKNGFQHVGERFSVAPRVIDRSDAGVFAVVFQADNVRHDAAARG